MRAVATIGLVLLVCRGAFAGEEAENEVYEHLVSTGIAIGDQSIPLPKPTLSPADDAQTQDRIVHEIAKKKHGYDDFVRESPVAPFVLVITPTTNKGGDRVHVIDTWFVAYGKRSDLSDDDLLGQLMGGGSSEKGKTEQLTDAQLKDRDLTISSDERRSESYSHTASPLLNKVQIAGIVHNLTTRTENSTLAASLLDPRFGGDATFPNRWRPYETTAGGGKVLGKAHAYAGFGGYSHVVELTKPAGALFIECHMAINEPYGWYKGKDLLRPKLPGLMQDNVRTIRRKLMKKKD